MSDATNDPPIDMARYEGHTEGDWWAEDQGQGWIVWSSTAGIGCVAAVHPGLGPRGSVGPNARLIADAPKLLARCIALEAAEKDREAAWVEVGRMVEHYNHATEFSRGIIAEAFRIVRGAGIDTPPEMGATSAVAELAAALSTSRAEAARLRDELASHRSLHADHLKASAEFRGEALRRATERRVECERVCAERDAARSERDALRDELACCLAWMRNDGWEPGMLESCDYRDTSGLAPGLVEWAREVVGESAGITEGGQH